MKYIVKEISGYFLIVDPTDGKTVKVYPEKDQADMYCRIVNGGAVA